jgi:hypothetical protein
VNEVVQHGACLGLGLAALATGREDLYEDLKTTLYLDNAVAGEAAALSIGLLLLGAGPSSPLAQGAITELLSYAHDTQHEKIIRGLALAVALIMYGQEENAEPLIEQLTRDRDPILRYGAMFTIGLAYAGEKPRPQAQSTDRLLLGSSRVFPTYICFSVRGRWNLWEGTPECVISFFRASRSQARPTTPRSGVCCTWRCLTCRTTCGGPR